MLRRVTFTVTKDSGCEHSVTIGRSEGSGSYCYADEAEAEVARWRAEAMAARRLLYETGRAVFSREGEMEMDAERDYATARAANGEE